MKYIREIQWWLFRKIMPRDLKEGTWLVEGAEQWINVTDMWRKSTKKGVWFIPRIEYHEEE